MERPTLGVIILLLMICSVKAKKYGGGGGSTDDCGDECPDDDYVECFQCDSYTVDGCGPLDPSFALGTDHVVYCRLSRFNCIYQDYTLDGELQYTRRCAEKGDYLGWHNTTDDSSHKLVCVTDRCNDAATHYPQLVMIAIVFILTCLSLQ